MHSFALWPTLIVLLVATFTDLRSRRIPNWLVFPFLAAGILVSPWRPDWNPGHPGFALHGFGWHGVGQCFAGLGIGFLVYGFLFFFGGMGAGDVKLCAAIGAWVGPAQMGFAIVFTAMAGGIIILCWAAIAFVRDWFSRFRKRSSVSPEGAAGQEPEPVLPGLLKRKMPYAPAIAVGTLLSFFAR
ncbi:MAG: prepilin peptidase [Terracidiphilus sp.]|jgi:prepilin peptidase CpaA